MYKVCIKINSKHELSIKIFEQIHTIRDEIFYGKFHLKKNKNIQMKKAKSFSHCFYVYFISV